jgi:hypothetical protein
LGTGHSAAGRTERQANGTATLAAAGPETLRVKCNDGPETGYNLSMLFATFAIRLLEAMFFVGLVGSGVVVLISFIEDAKELFGKD